MMGKFDVLEPCGAQKTKGSLHVFTQSGEQQSFVRRIMTNPCIHKAGSRGSAFVIRDSTEEEDADK